MTALFGLGFLLLGAVLGSFAGVIAERIYTGESWTRGRSRCNSCSRTLSGLDLIPVVSWLAWGGKCRTCRAKVPALYSLTEGLLALVYLFAFLREGFTLRLGLVLVAFFLLAVIVLYDLRHTVVPFGLSILLIAFALLSALLTPFGTLPGVLIGAGCIGLGFFLLYALSGGRWMGLGDAPVALALSLIVGVQAFSGLLYSFWIGAVVGVFILVRHPKGHRMGIEVPFVPFLAAGFLIAYFFQWNLFVFM